VPRYGNFLNPLKVFHQPGNSAGVDSLGRKRNPRPDVSSQPADHQHSRSIEQDDIPSRPSFPREDRPQNHRIIRRIAPRKGAKRSALQPKLRRSNDVLPDLTIADLGNLSRPREGNLIQPAIAMDDHRMLYPQQGHSLSDEGDEPGLVDAHHLPPSSRRIQQGPQDVQHRPHPKRSSNRHNRFQLRMMRRSQEKGEAVRAKRLRGIGGRKLDGNSQGLQHIRRAAPGRDRAVAMLSHLGSRRSGDQRGGGGDVEAAACIAARAAGIDEPKLLRAVERKHMRRSTEGRGKPGDLSRRLAAASQSAEQTSKFDVAGLAFEYLLHEGGGVLMREGFALFDDAA